MLKLIDVDEDEERYILVTELHQGQNLRAYLLEQPSLILSEERIREIILDIAHGIKGLHERRIIHRDIKLENILMSDSSPSAKACIADLGVATKLKSSSDTAKWKIGTFGYTCPEILLGRPYSFGCDVWGLGVIFHLLLTHRFPFEDRDEQKQELKVVLEDLDLQ